MPVAFALGNSKQRRLQREKKTLTDRGREHVLKFDISERTHAPDGGHGSREVRCRYGNRTNMITGTFKLIQKMTIGTLLEARRITIIGPTKRPGKVRAARMAEDKVS